MHKPCFKVPFKFVLQKCIYLFLFIYLYLYLSFFFLFFFGTSQKRNFDHLKKMYFYLFLFIAFNITKANFRSYRQHIYTLTTLTEIYIHVYKKKYLKKLTNSSPEILPFTSKRIAVNKIHFMLFVQLFRL